MENASNDPSWLGGSRRRRRGLAFAIVGFVVLVLAGAAWREGDALFGADVDPGTPLPAAPGLTADEVAFYEYVAPRLRAVSAETQKLAELGRTKSRNVIELERRGQRVSDISQEIDVRLAAQPVPDRFAAPIARYRTGITAVRSAIDESRSAFVTFDWDRVAEAVTVMELGADDLEASTRTLEAAAGKDAPATPGSTR